jgi:hypothetical protein
LKQHPDDNIVTKHRLGAFLGADCQRGATQVVGSGFLRADEGTVSPAWYVTAGAGGATEVREPMLGNFVKN